MWPQHNNNLSFSPDRSTLDGMNLSRRCLFMLLSICLSFQAAVIPVAAADQTDCGMDMSPGMKMSLAPADGMAHSHAGHSMMSDTVMSDPVMSDPVMSDPGQAGSMAGCCDADASARTDCLSMFDCHRCSASASVTSFAITGEFLTVIPASCASTTKLALLSPNSPPSDRWRPPISA
jgi:hypothetical protein